MIAWLSMFPFYYLFKSRLKSKLEKLSWFIICPIPIFYLIIIGSGEATLEILILAFLSLSAFYSIYEIGYLENDLRATLKEKSPTLRVTYNETEVLNKYYFFTVFGKLLVCLLMLVSVASLATLFGKNIYLFQFVFCLAFVRVFFYLHNTFRSKVNIFTYAALSLLKYLAPVLLFVDFSQSFVYVVVAFLMFPLLRTLEYASDNKYGLNNLRRFLANHDLFRVKYYFLCTFGVLSFSIINFNYSYVVFFYFLLARAAAYILVRFRQKDVLNFREDRSRVGGSSVVEDNN